MQLPFFEGLVDGSALGPAEEETESEVEMEAEAECEESPAILLTCPQNLADRQLLAGKSRFSLQISPTYS